MKKSKFLALGLIVLMLVGGLVLAGCKEGGADSRTLKVVNQYASPITKVEIGEYFEKENLSIATGKSQSFSFKFGEGGLHTWVSLYAEGLSDGDGVTSIDVVDFEPGETATITLKADGTIQ